MTLDLAWLLAQPLPDPVEGLRKGYFWIGMMEALLERCLADVRIDALIGEGQEGIDRAFDAVNEARQLCADLERAFQHDAAEVEDENLLRELEQERLRGYADGLRRLAGRDDRA